MLAELHSLTMGLALLSIYTSYWKFKLHSPCLHSQVLLPVSLAIEFFVKSWVLRIDFKPSYFHSEQFPDWVSSPVPLYYYYYYFIFFSTRYWTLGMLDKHSIVRLSFTLVFHCICLFYIVCLRQSYSVVLAVCNSVYTRVRNQFDLNIYFWVFYIE